jgi:voltage-gated potassium channel Kch
VVIDQNLETAATQQKLGRKVVGGNVADEQTLRAAGIEEASILVLTIPEEDAVIKATQLARAIKPSIYIVARTNYSSSGMQAAACGADDVIKAEQVVARQFYEMLLRKLGRSRQDVLAR